MRILISAFLALCVCVVDIRGQQLQSEGPRKDASARGADAVDVPESPTWLGSVRVPSAVLVDGKQLSPGTYRLRLTGEAVTPDVVGQIEKLEQWVEFRQGNQVKGRAVASLVPGPAIDEVAEGTPPGPGRSRVERLRGNEYLRIWYNHRGTHVLLHLPLASAS